MEEAQLDGILLLLVSCSFFHCSNSSALDQAKAMGHILSIAKDKLYDCNIVAWTFRAMVQLKRK
ncbi:putative galacturonosyltransferase 3 [Quercus suber]|uniref:Galacturonosyltransferase 3 n=1 Tax=Quercus suber TaxID=58331 RepID=A0AAW0J4Q2_QUESU